MYLEDVKPGSFVTRPYLNKAGGYIVYVDVAGVQYYWDTNEKVCTSKVRQDSNIWNHSDFEYCDKNGNLIKENKMRNVNYIGGEYKIVKATYELDGPDILDYNFKIDVDVEVKPDDIIVVDSSNGMGLCRVLAVIDNNIYNADEVSQAESWVIDVVDMTKQNARKEATKKREYIIRQLEEKKKAMEAVNMYAALAAADEDARLLLEELKTLGK